MYLNGDIQENLNQFNTLRFLAMSLKERHRDKITLKAKEETLQTAHGDKNAIKVQLIDSESSPTRR